MKAVDLIAPVLLMLAGLNWGLVGFFNYDLVGHMLGSGQGSTIAYDVVGLAALYQTFNYLKAKCAKAS